MTKLVVLYGGSFNPSTEAHRNIGLSLLDQLHPDEVWYLVSPQSPFKTKDGMASFHDRVAMAKLNLEGHSQLVVQDLEEKYARDTPKGIIETADTLKRLTQDFPDHRFIWSMGADNFAIFHTWGNSQYIADNFPIAIVPRVGYTEQATTSPSSLHIPALVHSADMRWANGWYLLKGQGTEISATNCRKELELGQSPIRDTSSLTGNGVKPAPKPE